MGACSSAHEWNPVAMSRLLVLSTVAAEVLGAVGPVGTASGGFPVNISLSGVVACVLYFGFSSYDGFYRLLRVHLEGTVVF